MSHKIPTAKEMVPVLVAVLDRNREPMSVRDLEQKVSDELGLTSEDLAVPHDKSRTEFQYRLAWTRTYAKKSGLVSSSRRNSWVIAG
jgi:restriction system protein